MNVFDYISLYNVVAFWACAACVSFSWSWNLLLSNVCNRYQSYTAHTDCFHHFGRLDSFGTFRALSETGMQNLRTCIFRVKVQSLTLGALQNGKSQRRMAAAPVWRKKSNLLVQVELILSEERLNFLQKHAKTMTCFHLIHWIIGSNSCLFLQASHLDSSLFVESTTRFFERTPYLSFTCRESQAFVTSTAQHVIQLAAFTNMYSWTFGRTLLLI